MVSAVGEAPTMTVQIVVYLNADTQGKEFFAYVFGRREYDALAGAFRALGSLQTEKKFDKLIMEAGSEWVVRPDTLQAIEQRIYDEPAIPHRIAVQVALAKRDNWMDEAVNEAPADAVEFR
jgi:hypothetical protein